MPTAPQFALPSADSAGLCSRRLSSMSNYEGEGGRSDEQFTTMLWLYPPCRSLPPRRRTTEQNHFFLTSRISHPAGKQIHRVTGGIEKGFLTPAADVSSFDQRVSTTDPLVTASRGRWPPFRPISPLARVSATVRLRTLRPRHRGRSAAARAKYAALRPLRSTGSSPRRDWPIGGRLRRGGPGRLTRRLR